MHYLISALVKKGDMLLNDTPLGWPSGLLEGSGLDQLILGESGEKT